jgi:hypothetical protein
MDTSDSDRVTLTQSRLSRDLISVGGWSVQFTIPVAFFLLW